jgi:hypothetical protein
MIWEAGLITLESLRRIEFIESRSGCLQVGESDVNSSLRNDYRRELKISLPFNERLKKTWSEEFTFIPFYGHHLRITVHCAG